jgi:hypothetical protein
MTRSIRQDEEALEKLDAKRKRIPRKFRSLTEDVERKSTTITSRILNDYKRRPISGTAA